MYVNFELQSNKTRFIVNKQLGKYQLCIYDNGNTLSIELDDKQIADLHNAIFSKNQED